MTDTHREPNAGRRGWLLLASGVLLVVFGWLLQSDTEAEAAATEKPGDKTTVYAVVEGTSITAAEVEAKVSEQLEALETQRLAQEAQIRQKRHELLTAAVNTLVDDRILEAEAKTRKISTAELIAAEITAKITPVSDADVDAFYNERSAQGQRLPPKERIAEQIRQFLAQEQEGTARSTFVATLRSKYAAKILFDSYRAELTTEGHPSKGPATAPVTIVEFSDFQCPYCSRILPTIEQALTTYGDKVRVVFRQFPLNSIHPEAQKAAEGSLCAADQGKFWEFHDALFANQQKLGVADLKATAAGLGLNAASFDSCLDSGKFAPQVRADLREGAAAGVTGTPAMFVNGKFLNGVVPFEALAQAIDAELATAK